MSSPSYKDHKGLTWSLFPLYPLDTGESTKQFNLIPPILGPAKPDPWNWKRGKLDQNFSANPSRIPIARRYKRPFEKSRWFSLNKINQVKVILSPFPVRMGTNYCLSSLGVSSVKGVNQMLQQYGLTAAMQYLKKQNSVRFHVCNRIKPHVPPKV